MKAKHADIFDFDAVLDSKYGAVGTPERGRAEEAAFSYYSGIIIRNARKEINMTQSQLAKKLGTSVAYISKVENNVVIPNVGAFFKMAGVLGYTVELIHV